MECIQNDVISYIQSLDLPQDSNLILHLLVEWIYALICCLL